MGVTEVSEKNGCVGSVGFGEENNVVCENECHAVLENTWLNQDWYSNNDECEVVTRLALKHGVVLQGDENKTFEQLIIFVDKKEKEQLKSLYRVLKAKVKCAVNKVNCVLEKIDIRNLTEPNTMYFAASYVSESVGAKKTSKDKKGTLVKKMVIGEIKGT